MITLDNTLTYVLSGEVSQIYSYTDLEDRVRLLREDQFEDCTSDGHTIMATLISGNLDAIDESTQILFRGVALKYPFKVIISTSTPPEDFPILPIAISKEELIEALKDQKLKTQVRIPLKLDSGIEIILTINSIGDPNYSADYDYSSLEIGKLECSFNEAFFSISKDRAKESEGVKFEISVDESPSYDGLQERSVNWIDITELRSLLSRAPFTGKSIFTVVYGIYKLTLTISDITINDVLKPLSSWVITPNTRVDFYINPLLLKTLIAGPTPEPLRSVKVFVKPIRTTTKNGVVDVDLALLEEALRHRKLPWSFKQEFELRLSDTHSVGIRVDELGYVDKEKEGTDYTYLGELASETKFKFNSNDRYVRLFNDSSKVKVDYTDVAGELQRLVGLSGLSKEALLAVESLVIPLGPRKEFAEALGLSMPKGVLLYGPPGTGKTTFARGIAKLFNIPDSRVMLVSVPELHDKYVGGSEGNIRDIFKPARNTNELCVVVLDEIDSLTADRSDSNSSYQNSVVTQLLAEMDGLSSAKNVIVFATTNRREAIDAAFLRDGRFGLQVEFTAPDEAQALAILDQYLLPLREKKLVDPAIDFSGYVRRMQGAPGSSLKAFVENAKRACVIRKGSVKVKECDFDIALKRYLKMHRDGDDAYKSMFS